MHTKHRVALLQIETTRADLGDLNRSAIETYLVICA